MTQRILTLQIPTKLFNKENYIVASKDNGSKKGYGMKDPGEFGLFIPILYGDLLSENSLLFPLVSVGSISICIDLHKAFWLKHIYQNIEPFQYIINPNALIGVSQRDVDPDNEDLFFID